MAAYGNSVFNHLLTGVFGMWASIKGIKHLRDKEKNLERILLDKYDKDGSEKRYAVYKKDVRRTLKQNRNPYVLGGLLVGVGLGFGVAVDDFLNDVMGYSIDYHNIIQKFKSFMIRTFDNNTSLKTKLYKVIFFSGHAVAGALKISNRKKEKSRKFEEQKLSQTQRNKNRRLEEKRIVEEKLDKLERGIHVPKYSIKQGLKSPEFLKAEHKVKFIKYFNPSYLGTYFMR